MTTLEEQITRAKKILLREGFRLSIDGCGCCGSPSVRLEYKGEPLIYYNDRNPTSEADNVCFDMFKEPSL